MFCRGSVPTRRPGSAISSTAYHEFREFDLRELALIEPLRTLRIIHHAAWIAGRWEDPAFRRGFPHFAEPRFWDEHVTALREQLAARSTNHRSATERTRSGCHGRYERDVPASGIALRARSSRHRTTQRQIADDQIRLPFERVDLCHADR